MSKQCDRCGCCPCDCRGDKPAPFNGGADIVWKPESELDKQIANLAELILCRSTPLPDTLRHATLDEVQAYLIPTAT